MDLVYCHHHHLLLELETAIPAQWSSEDLHAGKESLICRAPCLIRDWLYSAHRQPRFLLHGHNEAGERTCYVRHDFRDACVGTAYTTENFIE
jgi:hypothetical protein